jgi:hypothetical protein
MNWNAEQLTDNLKVMITEGIISVEQESLDIALARHQQSELEQFAASASAGVSGDPSFDAESALERASLKFLSQLS